MYNLLKKILCIFFLVFMVSACEDTPPAEPPSSGIKAFRVTGTPEKKDTTEAVQPEPSTLFSETQGHPETEEGVDTQKEKNTNEVLPPTPITTNKKVTSQKDSPESISQPEPLLNPENASEKSEKDEPVDDSKQLAPNSTDTGNSIADKPKPAKDEIPITSSTVAESNKKNIDAPANENTLLTEQPTDTSTTTPNAKNSTNEAKIPALSSPDLDSENLDSQTDGDSKTTHNQDEQKNVDNSSGTDLPMDVLEEDKEKQDRYNPKDRIDPFASLFKPATDHVVSTSSKNKTMRDHRKDRLTALEKLDLSQLKLTGILKMPSAQRTIAMVEEKTGKGHVIKKGTYIGVNSGRVVEIRPDMVIIEEEVENYIGDIVIRKKELKLQKPLGER